MAEKIICIMNIRRSFRLLSCGVAVMLLLLSLNSSATSCDEACSAEAPACECLCGCYGHDAAAPAGGVLPAMNAVQFGVPFESSQHVIVLATDIFRPPISR